MAWPLFVPGERNGHLPSYSQFSPKGLAEGISIFEMLSLVLLLFVGVRCDEFPVNRGNNREKDRRAVRIGLRPPPDVFLYNFSDVAI